MYEEMSFDMLSDAPDEAYDAAVIGAMTAARANGVLAAMIPEVHNPSCEAVVYVQLLQSAVSSLNQQ
jgi:hypothetical protein